MWEPVPTVAEAGADSMCYAVWLLVMILWRADSVEKTLMVGRRGGNRGWDGWMASLTQWTWVWANSRRWWRTSSLQGGLACCSPHSCKESSKTEGLNDSKYVPCSVRLWPCGFLTRVSQGDWVLSADANISDIWHTSCSQNFSDFCLMCVCAVPSVVSKSLQPARLLCPWNSPGKNTGVGCCALLQGVFLTRDWTQVSCFFCIGRQVLYPLCHLGSPSCYILLLFSHWVVSSSLWPDGLQHTRLPCPPLSPGVCSNSCPWSWWCYLV